MPKRKDRGLVDEKIHFCPCHNVTVNFHRVRLFSLPSLSQCHSEFSKGEAIFTSVAVTVNFERVRLFSLPSLSQCHSEFPSLSQCHREFSKGECIFTSVAVTVSQGIFKG